MKKMSVVIVLVMVCSMAVISCRHDAAAPQVQLYFPQVKTIINTNCVECHSPGGQGLPVDLTTDENIVQDAAIIKAATVDPASPRNRRMPPGGDLSDADKNIITAWFEKGGQATD